ncbi:MAG: radical SAM protein, partial [Chloroflexota bacterium]
MSFDSAPLLSPPKNDPKQDADYVFYELTRSICPECRQVIDAHILLRDNKVYMRKRCPDHGQFETLVYADAEAYTNSTKFNKPGTIPLAFSTDIVHGCPHDCGLCPDHQQHACVGIIEVNSTCDMNCPLCFSDAGTGFNLTLEEVENALDHFVRTEGNPEVVQFSGGEPSIHPEIIPMMKAAVARGIRHIMLNTNGKRIAKDDRFLAELAELKPAIYFQFDGFEEHTFHTIRGEADLLSTKLKALDRLAEAGCPVILVPAVERNINLHEVGRLVKFGLEHPAVYGINFQPAFHSGRHMEHNPLERLTIPDLVDAIETQTDGMFVKSDFVPVPCCFPTCNSVTYAYVDGDMVMPLPRILDVDDYLDYISNRVLLSVADEVRTALEGLWSSSAVPGQSKAAQNFALSCAACGLPDGLDGLESIVDNMFMIMFQDFMDPWTFNQKNLMKCCKEILLPDGKQVPFCAYNNVGYREQARAQLTAQEPARNESRRNNELFEPQPLTFSFDKPFGTPHSGEAITRDLGKSYFPGSHGE